MKKEIKINGYKITIEKLNSFDSPKFKLGDVISDDENKVGAITKIIDNRYNETFIPEGRGWYYWVEYNDGAVSQKEEKLKLLVRPSLVV